MNCPRCHNNALIERERDGVQIDVCTGCRGIWLDRGELEKLIARATRELDELRPRRDDRDRDRDRPPSEHRYRDHDDDDRHRYPRRKRSFFESLGEIFD